MKQGCTIKLFYTLNKMMMGLMMILVVMMMNGSVAHPASYPMGNRGSLPAGKAAGAWSWPSPPSSAEVKNAWSSTSTPQYAFVVCCSVKKSIVTTLPLPLLAGWRCLMLSFIKSVLFGGW